MTTEKQLLEILNLACYAWKAFEEFSARADKTENEYWFNEAREAHAKYRAYLNCYQVFTDRTLCGIESVKWEMDLLTKQILA